MTNQAIESLLPQGEENAIPTKELLNLTGIKTARDLQEKISHERSQGAVILSSSRSPGGYYRPSEHPATAQSEINTFVRTLRNRAKNTYRIAKMVQQSATDCVPDQQISLFN